MRPSDYPAQELPSAAAQSYRVACVEGSFGVPFVERQFGPDPHQGVAIYPAAKATKAPLLAFAHGGGWTAGYKEMLSFMAPEFTSRGIAFASIGYRLAPDHIFPTGVDDCATGLKLLYDLADEFGWDRRRIFVGGHSAGGHYAALLAVRSDWQAALGLPDDVIRGCLPISGVYRFGEGSGLSVRPRFLGLDGRGTDEKASPVLQITRTPPFLLAYGSNDFPHLRAQAEEMATTLRRAGGTADVIVMDGRDHFTASLAGGEAGGPWVIPALDFIKRGMSP